MSLLKRRTVDTKAEEQLLTGMIVSDEFCRDIAKLISNQTIETPYIARVVGWCRDYYYEYKQAPGAHLQDIFEVEKESLEKADQEAISALLEKLSAQYESAEINEEYLKDRSIELIKSRTLKHIAAQTTSLIEIGRSDEAEKMIKTYREVSLQTSGWEDPFAPEVVKNHFLDEQAQKSYLFKLPGAIGNLLGPFERNWLVGILAPSKRGKSFWTIELILHAIFARRKSIIISLEMNKERVRRRIYNRLTAMSRETRDYIYPVFDCLSNQNNSCNKANRKNDIRLLDSENKKPAYDLELKYRPCVECRGKKEFLPETWFTTTKVEKMRYKKAMKMIASQVAHFGYNQVNGSNLRVLAYPAFSANLSHIKGDIYSLIDNGFIPEVMGIDYPDILAAEDARVTGRDRIDQTWKTLKGMSDELHCCIFAPSQSTRNSFDKKNVTQTDAAEDIRKIANSDKFLGINQTPYEKKSSITRISEIASRDGDYDQFSSVICLQQLALGQVLLDSHLDRSTTLLENPYEDLFI